MDILTRIKANTDLVVAQLGPHSGIAFGLNAESVAYVEGFIERQRVRADLSSGSIDRLISVLGSFLGECIIASYGGEWREHEGHWAVRFGNGMLAFPFAKVEKQFANGTAGGDGISGFYRIIPYLLNEQLAA